MSSGARRVLTRPSLGYRAKISRASVTGDIQIPKDVALPALRGPLPAEVEDDLVRESRGGLWLSKKAQARLFRSPVALSPVTRDAAGHNVLPILGASPGHGNDVIVSQFRRALLNATVLAAEAISGIDVGTAELDPILIAPYLDVVQQPQHRRKAHTQGHGMDLTVVLFDDFNLLLEEHSKSFLPRDHLQRFVSSVEDERAIHFRLETPGDCLSL